MEKIKALLGILLVGVILIGCSLMADAMGAWLF